MPDPTPGAPHPPPGAARAYRATLRAYLGPQWPKAAALGAVMLTDISLDLLGPQLQRRFIDAAMAAAPLPELVRLAAAFLAVAVTVQALFVVANYISADLAQVGTNHLREDLVAHVLRLDHGFHTAHTPGDLIERIDGDVALLGNFLSRFILEVVGSVLLLAGALVLLWGIDWRIGAALVAFTGITFAVLRRLMGAAARRWEADRAAAADLFGFLEEHLAATEDIRASGAVPHAMRRFFEVSRSVWRRRVSATLVGSLSGGAPLALVSLGTVVGLAIGAWLYRAGEISLGTVYLIFSYSQLLHGPIEGLARQVQDLQRAGAAIGRVGAILTTPPRVVDPPRPVALPPGGLGIAFDGVTFAYGDGPAVIDGVTLEVPAGTSLGLLGRTGSGKTTLTRLLFRLVDPSAGAVRLGGVDLRDAGLADLRQRVALVTQDVQLFHASVRDNVTLFAPGMPDAAVAAAVRDVGLGDWLAGLPDGLDTLLAPGGGGLSAGQAQLLALARVFLRAPDVVVLDEASSRLDPATETRLEAALDRLRAGRTVVVIAHRLATVQRVDAVAVLDAGRVVEHGPRADLAADPASRFARLLRTAAADVDLDALIETGADGLPGTRPS